MTETTTYPSNPRLLYLDFLRGIAVLGLLTMNITTMGLFSPETVISAELISDKWVRALQALLLDGRFRSIFCLLFGIGLYLQFTRYQQLNLQPKAMLKSRLNWLLVFGVFHCLFLWYGDVLLIYALSGLVLIKRLQDTPEQIFKRGCYYFLIATVIQTLLFILISFTELEYYIIANEASLLSYQELYIENLFSLIFNILTFPILSLFYICGVMFIGIGLFRLGMLQQGFNVPQLWGLSAVTAIFTVADLLTLKNSEGPQYLTVGLLSSISGLTMALLFWHWVLKSQLYAKSSYLVTSVRSLGKRALSFYILQSLVMTTVLRFIFPQWNIDFTLSDYLVLAIAFIPVQLFIAFKYEQYFNQGPLEYWLRNLIRLKENKA